MIITTCETVANHRIVNELGIVCGNTVRAKHVGRDIMAGLKTLIGGEVRGYTEMLAESRQQAVDRMVLEAQKLGANAVVGVRYSTSAVAQGMSEMMAFGTAVNLERTGG